MESTNPILEFKRAGKELLQAVERDMFFHDHVKNLSYNKEMNTLSDSFEEMDPTPNLEYIEWLVNNYTKGKFRIENKARVKEALEFFNRLKLHLKQYGFYPDINQFDLYSLEELIDKIKGDDGIDGDTLYYERFKELDEDEYEILYDGPCGILVTPKTEHASCVLGRGTKWCTAAEHDNMFDAYNDMSPLYIWKDNTGLYQFWFGKRPQFVDNRDRVLSYDKIMEMRKKYPPLENLFKNKEKEIKSNPNMAYEYARDVIKGRWPDVEPYYTDIEWSYKYAMDVIKGRWPEAEPNIMESPEWAYKYARNIIKDRWPEAEPHIMEDLKWAYEYARDVIQDRWPEAEPYFMKDPEGAYKYVDGIIQGRWPDAEPYIMKDPEQAHLYAMFVINGRWPEAEPFMKKSPYLYFLYESTFPVE